MLKVSYLNSVIKTCTQSAKKIILDCQIGTQIHITAFLSVLANLLCHKWRHHDVVTSNSEGASKLF